jgi:hypothetical protein
MSETGELKVEAIWEFAILDQQLNDVSTLQPGSPLAHPII